MSWASPNPDSRESQLLRTAECEDRNCALSPELRDSVWARQWLLAFKSDPLRMATLRQMLASEPTGPATPTASDDRIIDEAIRLLTSGVWHVHIGGPAQPAPSTKGWKRAPGSAPTRLPKRKSCRIKTTRGDCLVIRAADLAPGEEFLEHTTADPIDLAKLTRGLASIRDFREIQQTFASRRASVRIPAAPSAAARLVEPSFHDGTLILVRDLTTGGSGAEEGADSQDQSQSSSSSSRTSSSSSSSSTRALSGGAPATSTSGTSTTSAASQQAATKTWFRMQLLDEDGQPMANEDYTVVDSAGASHKGKLDSNGEFYIPPTLPPGDCSITFPNIHLNPRKRKS